MKKRLFSLLLVCLLLSQLSVVAFAKEEKLYGEVPIYLGYPDLDYMAEEILDDIDLNKKDATQQIRAVYDWIILNCDRTGTADKLYFDVDKVIKQAEGAFYKRMVKDLSAGKITLRIDVAGEMEGYDGQLSSYLIPCDANYYIAQFASEMMLYRVGNCAHYAALLTLLLNHLGYDCRLIDGTFVNSDGSQVEHKWNMVLLDGKYYWLDPRMDHAAYERTGKLEHSYFLVEDTAQWEKRHVWDHSYSDTMMENAELLVETYGLQLSASGKVQPEVLTWDVCSAWAEPYLEKAVEQEIYPEAFMLADMTRDVTRAEFASVAVMFYQALSGKEAAFDKSQPNPFTDVLNNQTDVLTAYQLGIVNGMSADQFAPSGTLTREQAVTMLGRVVELVELGAVGDGSGLASGGAQVPAFTDAGNIGGWAKHYVDYFVSHGVVNGMGDGAFAPANNMTREQAMKVAVEALNQ